MGTDENDEPATVVEMGPDAAIDSDAAGLQSRLLLARARERLLGWSDEPAKVGRYRVVERIGTGGMGVVYAAHDDELDRPVAIKILRTDVGLGSAGRQRLLREAQAIAKLSHPNIVHVYEVGHDDGQVYMVMELVRGVTLRRWCTESPRGWQAIVEMFTTVGEGLAAAHAAGIVHRDFKPDNALVGDDGRPRVVDFGLARPRADAGPTGENPIVSPSSPAASSSASMSAATARLRELDVTVSGTVVGTPAYMAPEQLERGEPDARTDQFSFCASLYEMLYGKRPFAGSSYTELARAIFGTTPIEVDPREHGVPEAIHAVVLRGLRRDRADRYASMDELIAALRRVPTGRRPRWRLAAVAGTAVAAAIAAVALRADEPPSAAAVAPTTDDGEPAEPADPWAAIVAATDLPPTIDTAAADDPAAVTVHRLRNGLTVYVAHRPAEPYVATMMAVRAGVREESDFGPVLGLLVLQAVYWGTAGIGVLTPELERPLLALQHSLLAVLPALDDEAARLALLRGVAAAQNATADNVLMHDLNDATVALGGLGLTYVVAEGSKLFSQVPRHRLAATLALFADASRRPAFRGFLANVQDFLATAPARTVGWLGDSIARRELGTATGLHADYEAANAYFRRIPLGDAQRFHATYYRPNNTALVFVGDVTATEILPLVEQAFADWEPAPIPVATMRDEPLREPVVRHAIEDGGPPSLTISWPLPPPSSPEYPHFLALADSLARRDGLGAELRGLVDECSAWVSYARGFHVVAYPKPGQSLDQVESEVLGLVEAVANDRLADGAWQRALARAELERALWAFNGEDTATAIADSFIARRPWHEEARRLGGAPQRSELVAAAGALLARSRLVVQQRSGKPWQLEAAEYDVPRMPVRYGRHGPMVRALLDAPVTPPEPRFLVEGSHYQLAPHGAGQLITVTVDSPLVRVGWVYPVGVDEDPLACEAIKAHLRASPHAGIDFDAYCTNDDVWVDVVAAAEGFAERAPAVFAWLASGALDEGGAAQYVDFALGWRAAMRDDPHKREATFHAWAMRGEHGIDAHLPDDARLRRDGARVLPAALARAQAFDPDVHYVGPASGNLAASLPPPSGRAPEAHGDPMRLRRLDRPTVYLLHDPEVERASVRVAVPWLVQGVREQLAAQIHADVVGMAAHAGPAALEPVSSPWHWWAPDHPMATIVGYRCAPSDVELAVRTALETSRTRVGADQFAAGRRRLEVAFRAARLSAHRVPERVRLWGRGTRDPRFEQWMALPALSAADMAAYYQRIGSPTPIISVVANAETIDLAALGRFGEIVRVEVDAFAAIARDEAMTDAGITN